MHPHVPGPGPRGAFPRRLRNTVPLVVVRQEKLPQRNVPQLAARLQRGPNDVRHIDGDAMVERFRRNRMHGLDDRLFVSRSRPQGHQQFVPNQSVIPSGPIVRHIDDGTPSFRSVHHDFELARQPAVSQRFVRGILKVTRVVGVEGVKTYIARL